MIETPNLHLEKYELNDAANLADGYNNSMDKLDAAYVANNNRFPISNNDIANGAITVDKLATAAVTRDKIAISAFDDAVTEGSNKLVNSNTVYKAIHNAPANIANNSITNAMLQNGVVTANKIAQHAINASQLGFIFAGENSQISLNTLVSNNKITLNNCTISDVYQALIYTNPYQPVYFTGLDLTITQPTNAYSVTIDASGLPIWIAGCTGITTYRMSAIRNDTLKLPTYYIDFNATNKTIVIRGEGVGGSASEPTRIISQNTPLMFPYKAWEGL